ncbi:MAG TPA: hypothetical protein PLM13_14315, partial [Anaerolineales bacterium]|nr:hypothetical protein [Anaerolineales bacterium]
MKKLLFTLLFLSLLAACIPATESPPQTQTTSAAATDSSFMQSVQPSSLPLPTETNKPKGHNQPVVPTSASADFIATEILGRPTDTSITINVIPAFDMDITITYGAINGASQSVTATGKANTPQEILISNLQPNAEYFYSVNGGAQHTFNTARAAGSTFTFDIQGDSHPERVKNQFDPNLYTKTLLSAASDQPDFYIAIGDDFSVDTLK